MRRTLRQYIPSMFHRRLLLLGTVAAVVLFVLGFRALTLATGESQHNAERDLAASLQKTIPTDTIRGKITDRFDRPLAVDVPSYDVVVSYDLISGNWTRRQAWASLRKDLRRQDKYWSELSTQQQNDLYDKHYDRFSEYENNLWMILAGLGRKMPEEIQVRKDEVLRQVMILSGKHTVNRERRLEKLWDEEVSWLEAEERIREEVTKHWVLRDVPAKVQHEVRNFIRTAEQAEAKRIETDRDDEGYEQIADEEARFRAWRQVAVVRPKLREYPLESVEITIDRSTLPSPIRSDEPLTMEVSGLGLQVLGLMRDVYAEDQIDKPFADRKGKIVDLRGYRDNDRIGESGIEANLESRLRGARGITRKERGKVLEDLSISPIRGKDVRLTIDVYLQARIQGILSPGVGLLEVQPWHSFDSRYPLELGSPLQATVVVLDIETSEVLAAVSAPNYSLEQRQEDYASLRDDFLNLPLKFRPAGMAYECGSTIKPLLYAAAVTEGVIGIDEEFACDGPLDPKSPLKHRCWIFKRHMLSHSTLRGDQAIGHSCNIFFYNVGMRLGIDGLLKWLERFGMGSKLNSGVSEVRGDLPKLGEVFEKDAINMGIGQGPISWTPLQAAAAYAALARGGMYISPTFVASSDREKPQIKQDLNLDTYAVAMSLKGMEYVLDGSVGGGNKLKLDAKDRQSPIEPIFNIEGVDVIGKTGTAQAFKRSVELYDEAGNFKGFGDELRDGDHGWFITLVRPEGETDYKYVIAVVTDFGGSGKPASGPINNQVIHALKTEGYLP
ncbi:penicillin-binding transpeptidase domain-containing protein [Poriferisphaera sp. WC338]|uniref:penicillin-binding transpeptidase domain-containing protein n=1 Tax=Poriferisphaera sp. WC338 TaxID=3425129 RepID=UPI003D813B71